MEDGRAATLHRSGTEGVSQEGPEGWSEIVVSRQGVCRGRQFEGRRRDALPSYAASQEARQKIGVDRPPLAAACAGKGRGARMDGYLERPALVVDRQKRLPRR